mgnify:CR=1 FL=1
MKTLPNFDRVLYLVEHHGELGTCGISTCAICDEIKEARIMYTGTDTVKVTQIKKPEFEYTVISENGKTKLVYSLKDVSRYIKAADASVLRVLNTRETHNGFTVDRQKISG